MDGSRRRPNLLAPLETGTATLSGHTTSNVNVPRQSDVLDSPISTHHSSDDDSVPFPSQHTHTSRPNDFFNARTNLNDVDRNSDVVEVPILLPSGQIRSNVAAGALTRGAGVNLVRAQDRRRSLAANLAAVRRHSHDGTDGKTLQQNRGTFNIYTETLSSNHTPVMNRHDSGSRPTDSHDLHSERAAQSLNDSDRGLSFGTGQDAVYSSTAPYAAVLSQQENASDVRKSTNDPARTPNQPHRTRRSTVGRIQIFNHPQVSPSSPSEYLSPKNETMGRVSLYGGEHLDRSALSPPPTSNQQMLVHQQQSSSPKDAQSNIIMSPTRPRSRSTVDPSYRPNTLILKPVRRRESTQPTNSSSSNEVVSPSSPDIPSSHSLDAHQSQHRRSRYDVSALDVNHKDISDPAKPTTKQPSKGSVASTASATFDFSPKPARNSNGAPDRKELNRIISEFANVESGLRPQRQHRIISSISATSPSQTSPPPSHQDEHKLLSPEAKPQTHQHQHEQQLHLPKLSMLSPGAQDPQRLGGSFNLLHVPSTSPLNSSMNVSREDTSVNESFVDDPDKKEKKSHSGLPPQISLNDAHVKQKKLVAEVLQKPSVTVPASFLAKMQARKEANKAKIEFMHSQILAQSKISTPARSRVDISESAQKERRESCIRKWRLALACTLMGIRMTSEFKEVAKGIQNIQRVPLSEENSLLYMLKTHQEHADPLLTQKVLAVCDGRVEKNFVAIEQLTKILSIRLRAFSQFSGNTKLHFCRIMQYQKHPANALIVKEGYVSMCYYIIMSGQVEMFMIRDNMRHRLNILNAGDSFGRVHLIDDTNTACVSTLMDTELLCIDKREASETSTFNDQQELLEQLRRVPHFQDAEAFLTEAVGMFSVLGYEPNETILFEGTENSSVFWIVSGQCRCTKVVPFIQHRVKVDQTTRMQLLPYDPSSKLNLEEGDEVIHNLLTIHELGPGDCFPDMIFPEEFGWITESVFNRLQFTRFIDAIQPGQSENTAQFSVIASGKVVVASISRQDFSRTAPPKMLLDMYARRSLPTTSIAELQQAYLDKRKWDSYKREMIRDLRK